MTAQNAPGGAQQGRTATKRPRSTTGAGGRQKYGATRVTVDGINFASKREADWWQKLVVIERAGLIRNLRRQVRYPLCADGGALVGHYVADFAYDELVAGAWVEVVADAKGYPSPVYLWKRRHMRAQYGVEIREL